MFDEPGQPEEPDIVDIIGEFLGELRRCLPRPLYNHLVFNVLWPHIHRIV
jgi:hypothetical protein